MAAAFSSFAPFTTLHALTVVMLVAATTIAIVIGRRLRGTRWLVPFDIAFAATALVMWVVEDAQHLLARLLDLAHALHLEVCDLEGRVFALTLFFRRVVFKPVLFLWGFGLS